MVESVGINKHRSMGRAGRPSRNAPVSPSSLTADEKRGVFGHALVAPASDHVRLLFVNIGGLSAVPVCQVWRPCGSCKDCLIRSKVNELRVDVLGLSEVNVNWRHVASHQRLEHRSKGWFEACRISSACFDGYPGHKSAVLYGGTSIWSVNKMATRVDFQLTIRDSLGRWSGHGFRGRHGAVLVALVAYRPVVNKSGAESVWSQQYAHFAGKGQEVDPIARFDSDLQAVIRQLQSNNCHIVLGIDANEDLAKDSSVFRGKMEELGLLETILQQHGPGPPTMSRGSTKIDGLFVSPSLQGLKCGYTGWIADHTGLFMDVPMHVALGHSVPPILRPAMHRLKLQDPRVVAAYLASYKASLLAASSIPAMAELWAKAKQRYHPRQTGSCFQEWEHSKYVRLDAQCTMAMLEAERTCRKLFLGAVPWSPAFLELQRYQQLLYLVLRRRRGHKIRLATIWRQARRSRKNEVIKWPRAKLKRALLRVNQEIKDFKQQLAQQSRRTHNEKLVESLAAAKSMEATAIIRQIMVREEMRDNARIIRSALKQGHSGAVAMVQSTNSEGDLVTWTGKEDMEAAIMKECNARFRQASNTDFLTAPLYQRVGPLGVSPFCDRMLAGQLDDSDLEGVSEYAIKLARQLERPAPLRDRFCHPVPDLSTFQYGWRIQKEQTGAYPGRHFGHMMANVQDPDIAEFHRQLEYLPMLTGRPPPSWCKAVDVMIEKKAGNFQVDKLRAICLFDAVANHCFKYLGKAMMLTAEADGLLAKEQGGSRRGHRANFIGLEKRLSFDMSRQLRRPMALCSNDARACYDRIVHAVAALSLQRVGVPKPAVICMFSTIQGLEHNIRTIYGDSKAYFGGSQDQHLYGVPVSTIGQGNGAGPQIWALVSTPVLNMLRAEGLAMAYQGALTGTTVSFVGYSFVDDTDLGICAAHLQDPAHVAAEMQRSLDHWEGGLRATGGAIAPEKTFWYLMAYNWHADGSWSLKPEGECPAQLQVRDMHGVTQPIQRYPTNHAERTLGIYLAPDGSESRQAQVLYEKSVAWANKLRASHLPRHLATIAYRTTIDKSFSYPLVATCLTSKQCQRIQGPAMTAALQLSGIGSDTPNAVRTGPLKFQGLGFPDMYTTQLYTHIEALAFASEHPSRNTSQLLRVSSEQLKLELGVNGPLFDANMSRVHTTTKSWIQFTGECCYDHSIQLLDDLPIFKPRRNGDSLIMEVFRNNADWSPSTLGILNRCRIFLQLLYLSDMVHADGAYITEAAWNGQIDKSRDTPYSWPTQGPLSDRCWALWRTALQHHWCTRNRQLRHSLGAWDDMEPTTRFYFSPRLDILMEKAPTGWFQYGYSGMGCRRRVRVFQKLLWAVPRPPDLARASVQMVTPMKVRFNSWGASMAAPSTPSLSVLASMRVSLPEPTRWILDHVSLPPDEGAAIVTAVQTGSAVAVSDGSFEPTLQTGAAATTIQGANATNAIFASCLAPGQPADQSAYRSELIGLYQTIVLVHLLCRHYNVTEGSLELACDGLSALKQASKVQSQTPLSQSHFDIISACKRLMRDTPIQWKTRHVLGHQRERGGWEGAQLVGPLDRWATLNDSMDEAAKFHRVQFADHSRDPMPQLLYKEIIPICINGIKLCKDVQSAISEQVNGPPLLNYWRSKGKFGDSTDAAVDWQASFKAMKSLPLGRQQHQTKMISKFVAVRHRTKLRNHSQEDTCPSCLQLPSPVQVIETVDHLYTCPGADTLWTERMDELDSKLMHLGTLGPIRIAIVEGLKAWRSSSAPPVPATAPIQALITAQNHLGWHAAFEGRFAIGWAAAQEHYYRRSNAKPYHNGRRWLSQIIIKLFEISWDMWSQRNDALHQRETGIRVLDLRRQVDEEFALGTSNIARLRDLMKPGKPRIQQRLPTQIESWLHQVCTERQLRSKQTPAERVVQRQQSLMHRLFRPSLQTILEHG